MEPPQHHPHQADQESGNNNKSASRGNTCRQTSTRWTPTTEQIRILKDLYYNSGVQSPTADQIQKISATLRRYGKIEGKNVFYWFQNYKARERQKKKFNGTVMTTPTSSSPNSIVTVSDHYHHHHGVPMQRRPTSFNIKFDQEHHRLLQQNRSYPSFNNVMDLVSGKPNLHLENGFPGVFLFEGNLNHTSSGSECGAVNASSGYVRSHVYGSMEQDYSLSYNNVGGGWTNMDHDHQYHSSPTYNFFDRPKPVFGSEGYQEEDEYGGGDDYLEHRRTLPLFPMHGDDHINGGDCANWKHGQSDGRDRYSCASLELCLSSYVGVASD